MESGLAFVMAAECWRHMVGGSLATALMVHAPSYSGCISVLGGAPTDDCAAALLPLSSTPLLLLLLRTSRLGGNMMRSGGAPCDKSAVFIAWRLGSELLALEAEPIVEPNALAATMPG